jgi:Tfp pilus assembly protein PilF
MAWLASLALLAATTAALPRVVVLPPEPTGEASGDAWIGEVVADALPRDLARLDVPVVDRDERLAAHEALDIPVVPLSRATSIRFAESLRVTRVVTGTFERKGSDLTLSLRWLDVERGALSPPVLAQVPVERLAPVLAGLAWDLALAGPWRLPGTREAFVAATPALPFAAVEAYGRGLGTGTATTRIASLQKALKLYPAFDEARLALARLQIEMRDQAAAEATLAAVGEGSPLIRTARFLQGVARLERGRPEEASSLFETLADADPSPGVLANQALAVLRAGQHGGASALLRRAVDAAPGVTDIAFDLGWALLLEGDSEAAAFWFRGVTREAPRDVLAHVALAWALRQGGHAEEAAEEWRGVALLGPPEELAETPDLTRRLGRVLRRERPVVIERSDAELATAHLGRASAQLAAGDLEGALRELTRAAYLDPYSPRAHEMLARIHLQRGEKQKAVNELQMSLWCREDPDVRALLTRVQSETTRAP